MTARIIERVWKNNSDFFLELKSRIIITLYRRQKEEWCSHVDVSTVRRIIIFVKCTSQDGGHKAKGQRRAIDHFLFWFSTSCSLWICTLLRRARTTVLTAVSAGTTYTLYNCPLFFFFVCSDPGTDGTVPYAYIGQTVDVTATAPRYCKLVNILCYVDGCVNHGTTWLRGSEEGELVLQCHVHVKEGSVPRIMFHGLGLYSGEICSEPAFLHPIGNCLLLIITNY